MPASDIDAFMAAISGQESGGSYTARNSRTGAYGRFQIMPANWAPWSRETFGRVVARTAANQDKVARYKMLQYYRNYGSWDLVAAAWFGGPGAAAELKRGNSSVLRRSDGHWTIGKYISEMKKSMRRYGNGTASMYQPNNNRTLPDGMLMPNGPASYNDMNWANYDNLFGNVGSPVPDINANSDEFDEDQTSQMLLAAMDEISNTIAGGVENRIDPDDIESDDDSPDEETEDDEEGEFERSLDLYAQENQLPTEALESPALEREFEAEVNPIGNQDRELFQMPIDPLSTPFDAQSQSVRLAFQELGQNAAMSQAGDLGIPSKAIPDIIPPREVDNVKKLTNAGSRAIDIARRYLGIPYLWGGTNPKRGLDCSGLVQLVFKQLGVNLPRVSRDQARVGKKVSSLAQARPGDLVAFSSARVGGAIGHIGIYIGNGMMIEAPRTGLNVRISSLKNRPPTVIRRVL